MISKENKGNATLKYFALCKDGEVIYLPNKKHHDSESLLTIVDTEIMEEWVPTLSVFEVLHESDSVHGLCLDLNTQKLSISRSGADNPEDSDIVLLDLEQSRELHYGVFKYANPVFWEK